jgi:hypothetical protein
MTLDEFREKTKSLSGDTILVCRDQEWGDYIIDTFEIGEVRILAHRPDIEFIGNDEKDDVLEEDFKEGSWRAILLDTDLATSETLQSLEERDGS